MLALAFATRSDTATDAAFSSACSDRAADTAAAVTGNELEGGALACIRSAECRKCLSPENISVATVADEEIAEAVCGRSEEDRPVAAVTTDTPLSVPV
jgi:hypothetical protein